MSTYKGRVALVTGASSGIGAAIAENLVREGLIVVGAARRVERIQALSENLVDQPGRLIAKQLDVSKPNEIEEIFKTIEDELGGVDVLINNAAVSDTKPICSHTNEEIRSYTDVNQIAAIIATREAVNGMIRRDVDDGYIINLNSIAGHKAMYFNGVSCGIYPTTKYAITALCHQLRIDFKDAGLKYRVTSISPGVVATEMTAHLREAGFTNLLAAEDIARTINFVLSMPKSAEITEITIRPTNEVF